jgi:hypothetical protein
VHAAQHADDDPGAGPVGGKHPALAGGDHGHVPHVADAQPQYRGQDEVGPGEAAGHVVRAQHQIRALPPVQTLHDQAERGPRQAGQQAQLGAGRAEFGQRLVGARQREDAEPIHHRTEGTLEGMISRLSTDLVLRKQAVHDVGRSPAAGPVELNHRPDVGRGARHHALSGNRLREGPFKHRTVDCDRPNNITADQRYGGRAAHWLASSCRLAHLPMPDGAAGRG